jgi:hypothetical protein
MQLSLRDVVTLDVLLEHLQNSAVDDGENTVGRSLRTMRESLPMEGGILSEMLVMHIQTTFTPLLLDGNSADLPASVRARIREIIASLDHGRSRM